MIHPWHELTKLPDSLTCSFEFTDDRYYCINPRNPDELIIAAYPQRSSINFKPFWFEAVLF